MIKPRLSSSLAEDDCGFIIALRDDKTTFYHLVLQMMTAGLIIALWDDKTTFYHPV
jgi:hypothetical protein